MGGQSNAGLRPLMRLCAKAGTHYLRRERDEQTLATQLGPVMGSVYRLPQCEFDAHIEVVAASLPSLAKRIHPATLILSCNDYTTL